MCSTFKARLSEWWGQRHRDSLCCSALEANVCHNLIRFVDRHIFNHQAHRSLTLTHGRPGVMPELAETLWDLSYLDALLRPYLVLIALVVLLFSLCLSNSLIVLIHARSDRENWQRNQ